MGGRANMFSKYLERLSFKIGIIIVAIVLTVIILIYQYIRMVNTKVSKPEFNIVLLNEAFDEYINKSNLNNSDIDGLYKEIILDPIYQNFVEGSEYTAFAVGYLVTSMKDTDDLVMKLDLMRLGKIEKIVEKALIKCDAHLPGINTTVYVLPSPPEFKETASLLGGVLGCTVGSGKILLLVDPTIENWESALLYTVAHEYHHSIWTSQQLEDIEFTLIKYLIFEGRADSFASILYPEIKVPWTSNLTDEAEKSVWHLIKDKLNSKDSGLLYSVMFGGVEDYPYWTGYTMGYRIVQAFLEKTPDMSIETWTQLDASEIHEKSEYGK